MKPIELTPAEALDNAHGRLAAEQASWLRREALWYALGSLAFAGLAGFMAAGAWLHWQNPVFGGRGLVWIGAAIGGWWLWLLAPMPGRWRRVRQDLRAGQVAWVEGPAVCQVLTGFGLIAIPKYYVTVADRRFRVGVTAFGQFRAHDWYRAYLLPRSGLLVGAVRLAPPEAGPGNIGAAAQPAPARGPSPAPEAGEGSPAGSALNSREREILRLAAAGLSNKEIAGRLAFSVNTVKAYLSHAYTKLGVRRRTEAVARARELGVLGDDQK